LPLRFKSSTVHTFMRARRDAQHMQVATDWQVKKGDFLRRGVSAARKMHGSSRGSILLRPVRPSAGRVNDESLDKQWAQDQRLLAEKVAERTAAERERERWHHQHEFDREEMQTRLSTERDTHLALKAQTAAAERQLERELGNLPGHFAKDFEASESTSAARREETRRAMAENARLMRERLDMARAAKLTEIASEAAQGDDFNERFTKPSWREQAKYAQTASSLAGLLPTADATAP